jgi:hypothetical protein
VGRKAKGGRIVAGIVDAENQGGALFKARSLLRRFGNYRFLLVMSGARQAFEWQAMRCDAPALQFSRLEYL